MRRAGLALFVVACASSPACALIDSSRGVTPSDPIDASMMDAGPPLAGRGAPCTADEQCADGACAVEARSGIPGGVCTGCSTNDDCGATRACELICTSPDCSTAAAACLPRCTGDADCAPGLRCETDRALNVCRPLGSDPDLTPCSDFAECASGYCLSRLGIRACFDFCFDDDECPSGSVCSDHQLTSHALVCGRECEEGSCDPGSVCACFSRLTRGCQPRCDGDGDCYVGSRCDLETGLCGRTPCAANEACPTDTWCGYFFDFDAACDATVFTAGCRPTATTGPDVGEACRNIVACNDSLCAGAVLTATGGYCARTCPDGRGCGVGTSCQTVRYASPASPTGPFADAQLCIRAPSENAFGPCGTDAHCPPIQHCDERGYCDGDSPIGGACDGLTQNECTADAWGCTWTNSEPRLSACTVECTSDSECRGRGFPGGCCWSVRAGETTANVCATAAMCATRT